MSARRIIVAYVFNNMAVIANEQECTAVRQVDLHANQPCRKSAVTRVPDNNRLTICMAGEVMQVDSLTKIHILIVKGFPVPSAIQQGHIELDVY